MYADDELIIYVSTGDGKVDVPDVLGKSESDAKKELEDAGFKVKVSYDEDSDEDDGIVLKQSSKKAKEGATITITVNKLPELLSGELYIDMTAFTDFSGVDEEGNPVNPSRVTVDLTLTSDGEGISFSGKRYLYCIYLQC